jgi:hypothetical protein
MAIQPQTSETQPFPDIIETERWHDKWQGNHAQGGAPIEREVQEMQSLQWNPGSYTGAVHIHKNIEN